MTSPLPLLVVGVALLYLSWHHTATRTIWLAVSVLDTYRALRVVRPNGRRIGVNTRRKAIRSSLVCWVVYVLGTTFSPFVTTLFGWLPLFPTVKAIVCICFLFTRLSSSISIYNLLAPFMKPYETPIDLTVQLVQALAELALHYAVVLPLRAVSLGPVGRSVVWGWQAGIAVLWRRGVKRSTEIVEMEQGKGKKMKLPGKEDEPASVTSNDGKRALAALPTSVDPSSLLSPGPPIPGALFPRLPPPSINPARAKPRPQPKPTPSPAEAPQPPPFPAFLTLSSTMINPIIIPPSPSPSPPSLLLSRSGPSRSTNAEAGPSTPSRGPALGVYPDISTVKKGMLDVEQEMEVRRSPRRNKGVRMEEVLGELGGRGVTKGLEEGERMKGDEGGNRGTSVGREQERRRTKWVAAQAKEKGGGSEGRRTLGAPVRSRTSAQLMTTATFQAKGKIEEKLVESSTAVAGQQKLPRGTTTSGLVTAGGPSGVAPRKVMSASRAPLEPRAPPPSTSFSSAHASTSTASINPLKQPPSRALPRSMTLPSRSLGVPSLSAIPTIPSKASTTRSKPAPKPRMVKPDPNGVASERLASTAPSRARAALAVKKEKEKGGRAGDKRGLGAVLGEGTGDGVGRRKKARIG